MSQEIIRNKQNVTPSSNQEIFSTIFQEINTLKEYSQKHEQALHKLELTLEHLNRELIKREAETPWIIKAIEEANQKTTQVFIDLINNTYGNNRRLFKIIFILLGAILALSGAREAVTILFK